MNRRCLMIFFLIILFTLITGCISKKESASLVLGVNVDEAVECYLEKTANSIKDTIREKGIVFDRIERIDSRRINIKLVTEELVSPTRELMNDFSNFQIIYPSEGNNTRLQLSLREQEVYRIKASALKQALETIRNRIHHFGVSGLTIQKQGIDKIVVNLPGIKPTKRIVDLICRTAHLEFKLVDNDASLDEALKGNISPEDEILYEKRIDSQTGRTIKRPYLLKKRALMTGNAITDADVRIGGRHGESYVGITFDKSGAKLFEQITEENIGRRLAIILDKNVYAAPIIREKIVGGRAQITGRFTYEEAHDLAIILMAGALPVTVVMLQKENFPIQVRNRENLLNAIKMLLKNLFKS